MMMVTRVGSTGRFLRVCCRDNHGSRNTTTHRWLFTIPFRVSLRPSCVVGMHDTWLQQQRQQQVRSFAVGKKRKLKQQRLAASRRETEPIVEEVPEQEEEQTPKQVLKDGEYFEDFDDKEEFIERFGRPPRYPRTIREFKISLQKAWKLYVSTFDEFKSKEDRVDDNEDSDGSKTEKSMEEIGGRIQKNVAANREFLKEEGGKALENLKRNTGIRTREDAKRLAAEMLKLGTECISQFMAGYRKGRDDEVEKMLTEYFQEIEEQLSGENTKTDGKDGVDVTKRGWKRTRKPKRRIIHR